MPEGRNLRVFFQEAGIRKGVRRGDGILVGILQRAESGYGFSKRVQITNYPLIEWQFGILYGSECKSIRIDSAWALLQSHRVVWRTLAASRDRDHRERPVRTSY